MSLVVELCLIHPTLSLGYICNASMEIILNGNLKAIPDNTTATQLVALLELQGKRLAIEINEEIVPRSTFDEIKLSQGDKVEIVRAIGGG